MTAVLGIDLGTTNSVVCVSDGGEPRVLPDADGHSLIPSVVSFHPAGDVLVGHAARERRLLDARNTIYSVKRLIGRPFRSPEVTRARERFPFELAEGPTQGVLVRARGESYTLPEISAFVLREVRRIAEERLERSCTQAVITVPANFNELQRSATKAAGRVAGLEVLRILNEPTAAALAYGYGRGSRERIAIFDLGGGTFDITILELAGDVFEVLSTAGDTFLGGDDLDVLISDKMADAFLAHHRFDPRSDAQAYERLRAAAEWAKCQLSTEQEVQLRIEELAYGEAGASLDLTFGMTRGALEGLVGPLIARAFDVCEDAMRVAGIRPTQLDNVILVGGSTRIPMVRQMVADYFGREPLATIDPDLVVARGAALQAAALAPERDELSGPKRLARVELKKMTKADLQAQERREELKSEVREQRPVQPAFQPPEPELQWAEMEELPTRVATAQQRAAANVTAETSAASGLDAPSLPTVAAATAYGRDAWRASAPPPEATVAAASAYQDEAERASAPPPAPTMAGTAAYRDEAKRASTRPAPTAEVRAVGQVALGSVKLRPASRPEPPTPPPRGGEQERPPIPVGARTLGFGSGGLPVPPELSLPDLGPPEPRVPDVGPPERSVPDWGPPDLGPEVAFPTSPPPVPSPSQAAPPVRTSPPPRPPAHPVTPPTMPMPIVAAPPPVAHPPRRAPLLLDVTPHTLGVETVSGYCEGVIARNAAIPVEQTRVFSTGQDDQQSVEVRIFQGESRRLLENQPLGQIQLTGIRSATRGAVTIEVTFLMDADGTLGVRARDAETGQEQIVRIDLVGGATEDEIQRMQERQARMVG